MPMPWHVVGHMVCICITSPYSLHFRAYIGPVLLPRLQFTPPMLLRMTMTLLAVLFVCFLSASAARGYLKDDLYSRHAANLGSLVQVQNLQDSRHDAYFPHQHVATSCLDDIHIDHAVRTSEKKTPSPDTGACVLCVCVYILSVCLSSLPSHSPTLPPSPPSHSHRGAS